MMEVEASVGLDLIHSLCRSRPEQTSSRVPEENHDCHEGREWKEW